MHRHRHTFRARPRAWARQAAPALALIPFLGVPACSATPVSAVPAAIADAPAALAEAQADARRAAASLRESASSILASSTTIRSAVGVDPLAPRISPALDAIDAHARRVEVQASVIDPALLSKLDAAQRAASQAVDSLAKAQRAADAQAKRIADLESLTGYIPWAVALIVAGCVGVAVKLYPPLSWIPAEIGAGVAAAGLLVLVFIMTWTAHPWIIVGGAAGSLLAILTPTIVRLNTHPVLNPRPIA